MHRDRSRSSSPWAAIILMITQTIIDCFRPFGGAPEKPVARGGGRLEPHRLSRVPAGSREIDYLARKARFVIGFRIFDSVGPSKHIFHNSLKDLRRDLFRFFFFFIADLVQQIVQPRA